MAKRGRKKQLPPFKVGDIVTCKDKFGEWELVWYDEEDSSCAIQNQTYRVIAKVNRLKKIS